MIVINNTRHAVIAGDAVLLPGSNTVARLDTGRYPLLADMVERGDLSVSERPTESQAVEALRKANTQEAVDAILSETKGTARVRKAAAERKSYLDDFDAEVRAAREAERERG